MLKMATVHKLKLSFIEDKVLTDFTALVESEIPEAIEIIVYGSRARGNSSENSDLDIAVIVDIPEVHLNIWKHVWDIKWRVLESLEAEEYPLSLNIIKRHDLTTRDTGVEKAIKTEGKTIWKRKSQIPPALPEVSDFLLISSGIDK